MKKTFLAIAVALWVSSCTLRNPALRGFEEHIPEESITLDRYIRTVVDEYTVQNEVNKTPDQTAPQIKYRFGDIVLAVPDNIRVYGRQIERRYGNISEILPQGWRFLYRSDQGRFVYSFGNEHYPTIGETEIQDLNSGKKKEPSR